jgi:dTDP-4-dehydrorhamnose reductase
VRALITGGAGQLACDLQQQLGTEAVSLPRDELDICDPAAVERAFAEVQPTVVFNCAAFHNLDACEREPPRAWDVNVRAVLELARRGIPLVHISTNYVFDGRAPRPYAEGDAPSPRSVYALTKLAGEYAALAYNERALVIRTAGLYGLHGSASKGGNFVQRMIARARSGEPLTVVADQRLQPTFTGDLASALIAAAAGGATGTVHLTASGDCSWHEFTQAIMELAGIDVAVQPARTEPVPGGVDRPLNGVLARPRADKLGLPVLRHWREGLADYMRQAALVTA